MRKSILLASAAFCVAVSPAYAQDAAQTAQAEDVPAEAGEIIVTATRRDSALSDVPLAVSAVTAESLQNSGANDIRQLNQLAPSLLVSSTGSEANGSARIRGVGTVGDNPGLESSVAVFIDGVYRSRSGIGLNELGEIERVEVLRGPQGTLFGRNASAGLLHVISKKPQFDFGGSAELSYGNFDAIRASGSITGPVSETIALRLDGVYSKRDGFYTLVDTANKKVGDLNDRDRYFFRAQALFEPNDSVSFRLIGDYTRRTEACCGAAYINFAETFDPTPNTPANPNTDRAVDTRANRIVDVLNSLGFSAPPGGIYSRRLSISPGRSYAGKTTDGGVSGELNWDFGSAKLTSITAYRDYKSGQGSDTDYGTVDLLFRDPGGNFRQFKTFTQELRLQGSAFNDKLDWLVGGFFTDERLQVKDNIKFGNQYGAFAACRLVTLVSASAALRNPAAAGCLTPTGIATLNGAFGAAAPVLIAGLNRLSTVNNVGDNNTNYFQKSRNYAFFTHNIFHITDTLDLTLGVRYTNEDKKFRANFNNNNTVCPTQQAFFAPFLTGGATAFPAAVQGLAGAIVNLTCQGNSSSSLNALNLSDQRKEDEFTGTAVVSWKPTKDVLLYAGYSKGYKAGGFNLDRSALGQPIFSPTDPRQFGGRNAGFNTANLQFDAEKVDAYEAGLKYNGRKFDANLAVFRQEFKDFQLNTFNGSVFLVQNVDGCGTNLGGADRDASDATGPCARKDVKAGVVAQGFELELAAYPARNFQVTAGLTYARTKFAKNLVGRNDGTPLSSSLFLLPGDNLSNAPELVATGSVAWTPELGSSGYSALFYADTRLTGDYNTGSDLFPEKEQDGFAIVNARVGIRGPEQRYSLEFFVQNLFDKDYQQVAFNTPFQGGGSRANVASFGGTGNQIFSAFLAEPRTYGVTLRGKF